MNEWDRHWDTPDRTKPVKTEEAKVRERVPTTPGGPAYPDKPGR